MKEIQPSDRVFGLDILRALAILPVVIVHAHAFLNKITLTYPWVRLYDGVDVFFVLSGFLIGSILIKTFCVSEQYTLGKVLSFLKRRWFRTLPNYFLVMLINFILVYTYVTPGDLDQFNISFLVFCQNLWHPFQGFYWESWSLTIEEWFYFLFPLILLLLALIIRNKMDRKYLFLTVILLFLLIPLTLRIYRGLNFSVTGFSNWEENFRKIIFLRLDCIGWGILVAYLKFYYNPDFYRFKYILFFAGIIMYFIVDHIHKDFNGLYMKAFYSSLTPIAIAFILPLFDSIKHGKGIVARIITHISKISYSMYLINLGLVAVVIGENFLPTTVPAAIIAYIVYWFAVIVISSIMYKFFEKPIMDLRDKKLFNPAKKFIKSN
jgi:peptidoglycan/LPS O-acetylase OafA/YrhL